MLLPRLPATAIPQFARLNLVLLNGVQVGHRSEAGLSLTHVSEDYDSTKPLVNVEKGLVAAETTVAEAAKADVHLANVLEVAGPLLLTPRGAVMVFLVVKLSTAARLGIGVGGCWSEYVKFLPAVADMALPIFWSEEERELLRGTSLHVAIAAKLQALEHEFETLRAATSGISWCDKVWWNEETLTLHDWMMVDGWYRSRVLEIPKLGASMVPMIDLVNHGKANAHYSINNQGDVVLLQNEDIQLQEGEEILINYGQEKSAAEMLFSYGFIEEGQSSTRSLALDFECPMDDPLKPVKEAAFKSKPMLSIIDAGDDTTEDQERTVIWTGPFVWLACVNEEDGLSFRVLQETSGKRRLQVLWNEEDLDDLGRLVERLEKSELWPVFQLRALALVIYRLEEQFKVLEESEVQADSAQDSTTISEHVKMVSGRLRRLELELIKKALEAFKDQRHALLDSKVVRDFLAQMQAEEEAGNPAVGDDEDDKDLA